jgi:hypothetical protein
MANGRPLASTAGSHGMPAAEQMTDLSWDESTPSVLEKRPEDSKTAYGLETIE